MELSEFNIATGKKDDAGFMLTPEGTDLQAICANFYRRGGRGRQEPGGM